MHHLLQTFSGLTVAFAGIAFGMCVLITSVYWKIYKGIDNGKRLLPLHIMAISTSYAMLALVAVFRLGGPLNRFEEASIGEWWVYPFVTVAFLLGDIALTLILLFISRRGSRYPKPNKEDKKYKTNRSIPNY